MRYAIVVFLCLLSHTVLGVETSLKDSLLHLLARTAESRHKADIYRDLADIHFELPQERHYLSLLITESILDDDKELLLGAYSDLADSYIRAGEADSARIQLEYIDQMSPTEATKCQRAYLNIRLFNSEVVKGSGIDAINDELKKQTDGNGTQGSIYFRIEHAYNIASALEIQNKYHEALPYINTAVDLASTLPFKDGGPLYITTLWLKQRIFLLDGQYNLVIPLIEKRIELQETYYQRHLKNSRPFYPIDGLRISDYTHLIMNIRHLSPEKVTFYMQKIIDLSSKSHRLIDKYRGFLCVNNYHLFKKDYPKALITNDSLIKYAPIVVASYLLPSLHNVSSQIYEVMGDYESALGSLKTSYRLQDSIASAKSLERINELQVQYDMNKLNYEKSQLEVKNKLTMLTSLSIGLIISLLISIYLYRNMKKEKAMKVHLRILNDRAEESENMKRVFVSSICHEIRTPLNSIVGFTDLIFDPDIDQGTKQTFPAEIQKNTRQLMGLIDTMLEVANLDVSDQKLPCELADISAICQHELDRMKEIAFNPSHCFHLELPQTPSVILTHEQYLSLVIDNLLSNAKKFTSSGDITLEYHEDKASGRLCITVTDTGCGIPLDRQQDVFERFVKINAFIPGNGLGLYLCRLIVRRLSGEIAIDPDYTQGTRVVVYLPLVES